MTLASMCMCVHARARVHTSLMCVGVCVCACVRVPALLAPTRVAVVRNVRCWAVWVNVCRMWSAACASRRSGSGICSIAKCIRDLIATCGVRLEV